MQCRDAQRAPNRKVLDTGQAASGNAVRRFSKDVRREIKIVDRTKRLSQKILLKAIRIGTIAMMLIYSFRGGLYF